jgi:REP element-mobilizing transposase RayT
VQDGVMVLSDLGQIAQEQLAQIPLHWSGAVELDLFVVMPNHVHAILVLADTANQWTGQTSEQRTGQALSLPPVCDTPIHDSTPALGTVIGLYKSGVTRRIREQNGQADWHIWQGRYHDHIIRNPADLERIQQYVVNNPACWTQDTFYEP